MTDRIDLDDVGAESDEADQSTEGHEGDWFWRAEGPVSAADPTDDPWSSGGEAAEATTSGASGAAATDPAEATDAGASADNGDGADAVDAADTADPGDLSTPSMAPDADAPTPTVPHVPYENRDRPVGIPRQQGGAGGATGDGTPENAPEEEASGPHGGGADDMTMAFTYEAMQRIADVRVVLADANGWCDWLGVVGDVPAHVLTKFQREHGLDLDFFNGSGTGPAERLAEVDEHSMFYAERMVVVGVDGEEALAERAGWEFVPLAHAAEKAGWELTE